MSFLSKLSCLFFGISFSLRMHSAIAFGVCLSIGVVLILIEKRLSLKHWLYKCKKNELTFPIILFLITFLISCFFSINQIRSISVLGYLCLFIFFSYIIFQNFKSHPKELKLLSNFLYISIIFSVLFVLFYNFNEGQIFETLQRKETPIEVIRFKGFVNVLTILVLILPLLNKKIGHKKIYVSTLPIILIIPVIITSNCNSAVLGIFVGILSIFFFKILISLKFDKNKLLSLLIFKAIFIISVTYYFSYNHKINTIENYEFLVSTNLIDAHRQIIWGFSLENFEENPVFGVGPDTSNFIKGSQKVIGHESTGTMHYIPSHPHNFFIELLLETGVVGTLSFIFLIFSINYFIFKRIITKDFSYVIFFNGYFWGASLVNFSFWNAWWQVSYFFILAIISSILYSKKIKKFKF